MIKAVTLFVCCVLCAPIAAKTQVADKDLKSHRLMNTEPAYPPIAKAAGVEGLVRLEITINASGTVVKAIALSGPEMLRGSAITATMKWTYRPFLNEKGEAITVHATVEIPFAIENHPTQKTREDASRDRAVADQFFPLQEKCSTSQRSSPPSEAATACKQAADTASGFAPDTRFIERRSASVHASLALMNTGAFSEALHYAELAVEEVSKGHDDDSGSNAAYTVRGESFGALGDFEKSDADLSHAEALEHKAIEWAKTATDSTFLLNQYKSVLRRNLRVHAAVLQRLGQDAKAQEKLAELDTLQ